MGELTQLEGPAGTSAVSTAAYQRSGKKANYLGGPMAADEIKMNRDIMQEISKMKKQMNSQQSEGSPARY